MKNILKEWMTSVIGLLFLTLGGYLFFTDRAALDIVICVGIGLVLLYAKDTFVLKFVNYLNKIFK